MNDQQKKLVDNGYLTVKQLKEVLDKLDENSLVYIQRVEDIYYEKHGWETLKKETNEGISQYSPAWCTVEYNDNTLYLDSHY